MMKSTSYTFEIALLFAVLLISLHATAGPKTQPNEGYKVDVASAGATFTLFKLFTIQPTKKAKETPVVRKVNPAKTEAIDKRDDDFFNLAPQDKVRK